MLLQKSNKFPSSNSVHIVVFTCVFFVWIKNSTTKSLSSSIKSHSIRDDSIYSAVVNHRQLDTFNLLNSSNLLAVHNATKRHRSRRNANSGGWNKFDITWSFDERTLQSANLKRSDAADVIRSLSAAFDVWSYGTCLKFYRKNYNGEADMKISFERGDHGDGSDFHVSGPLGHGHHPGDDIGGDIHFNADVKWKLKPCDTGEGAILQYVAVHEIGHALGLGHSKTNKNAIMFYVYFESPKYNQLSEEDIRMLEKIYGRCRQRRSLPQKVSTHSCATKITTPAAPTDPKSNELQSHPKPNICNTNFDAITMFRGQIWLFKNQFSWRLNNHRHVDGPSEITQHFKDLSTVDFTHIDAAFETESNGIMFFIGKSCYYFDSSNLDRLYHRYTLSEFGLPSTLGKIDAVLKMDRTIYLFSGVGYYEFDEKTLRAKTNQPQSINKRWQGISHVNAAFQDTNRMIYFLKRNTFIEYNDAARGVKRQTSITQWANGCPQEPTINPTRVYGDEDWNQNRRRINEEVTRRNDNRWDRRVHNRYPPRTTTHPTRIYVNKIRIDNRGSITEEETQRNYDGISKPIEKKPEKPKKTWKNQGELPNDIPTNYTQNEQQHHEDQAYENATTILNNDSSAISTNHETLLLHLIIFTLWHRLS